MRYTCKIRQHTPMLQFQAEQENAFLRASDLKARIDKVLENTVTNNVKKIKYRLQVENVEVDLFHEDDTSAIDSLYFARTVGDKKTSQLVMAKDKIFEIQVHTFDPDFNEETFEKALRTCLLMNNFGTRASKGFGSFSLEGDSQQIVEQVLREQLPTQISLFRIDLEETDLPKLFSEIDSKYKLIHKVVCKNKMQYPCKLKEMIRRESKNIIKKLIKQMFFGQAMYDKFKVDNNTEGIAFDCTEDGQQKSNKGKKSHVDRIPSPIIFKPMDFDNRYKIYLYLNPAIVNDCFLKVIGHWELGDKGSSDDQLVQGVDFNKDDLNWLFNSIISEVNEKNASEFAEIVVVKEGKS